MILVHGLGTVKFRAGGDAVGLPAPLAWPPMTADLVIADIQQGAPMMGALLAIAGLGWLVYRVSSRRRSDRDPAGDRSRE
jgi:hypothetical protein